MLFKKRGRTDSCVCKNSWVSFLTATMSSGFVWQLQSRCYTRGVANWENELIKAPEGSEGSWGTVADTLELSWGWDISGLAAEEGGVPLTNAHSEVGELLIAMQHLSCGSMKHFRDWGSSNSWECDCNSIKVENDGSLALDQKQIGGRYVINYTLFILFWRWTFCLLVNL